MPQDGHDAPASPAITPTRLQVVLLAYNKDGTRDETKDHYALIRFPQSYEDAIAGIEQNLGEYLPGGKADAIDIFCRMRNTQIDQHDEWIWAKADRKDWDLVRGELALSNKALGIRLRNNVPSDDATKRPFTRGPLIMIYGEMVTYGDMEDWGMRWTPLRPERGHEPQIIPRPASYQEAGDSIVAGAKENPNMWYPLNLYFADPANDGRYEFKFSYFTSDQSKSPNTVLWADFPASAYEDDEIWRSIVPEPHSILGFTMDYTRLRD